MTTGTVCAFSATVVLTVPCVPEFSIRNLPLSEILFQDKNPTSIRGHVKSLFALKKTTTTPERMFRAVRPSALFDRKDEYLQLRQYRQKYDYRHDTPYKKVSAASLQHLHQIHPLFRYEDFRDYVESLSGNSAWVLLIFRPRLKFRYLKMAVPCDEITVNLIEIECQFQFLPQKYKSP